MEVYILKVRFLSNNHSLSVCGSSFHSLDRILHGTKVYSIDEIYLF